MKTYKFLAIPIGLLITSAASAMTVNLSGRHIVSTDFADVEIFDRVCNRSLGVFRVKGNATVPIDVCVNSAGYGDVAIRSMANKNTWYGTSFVRAGDNIYP